MLRTRSLWMVCSALAFLLLFAQQGMWAQESIIKLSIIGLSNPSTLYKSNIGNSLVDQLTTQISAAGKYKLLERDALQALRNELNLGESGLADAKTFAQKGGLTGADFLLLGKISDYTYTEQTSQATQYVPGVGYQAVVVYDHIGHVRIDMRLVDVKTGEDAKSFSGEGRADVTGGTSWQAEWGYYVASQGQRTYADLQTLLTQAANQAIQRAVSELNDAYDDLATIRAKGAVSSEVSSVGDGKILASVGQGQYVIGVQSTANLKVGDRFDVVAEIPIKNSQGVAVYNEKRTVGTLQITDISESTKAMARLVNAPGAVAAAAQPSEGDALVFDESYGKSLRGMPTAASAGATPGGSGAASGTAAVQSYLQHGDRFLDNQEYSEALDQYREGLAVEPNNPTLLSGKAEAELGVNDFPDAEDDAEKAIAAGGSVDVHLYHGHAFGHCEGTLVVERGKVSYAPTTGKDGFTATSKAEISISQKILLLTKIPGLVIDAPGQNGDRRRFYMVAPMFLTPPSPRVVVDFQVIGDAADKTTRLNGVIIRLINASLQ